MDVVEVTKKNEVFLHVKTDAGILYEISDNFTFEVPGAKFMPTYKSGVWDGKIRLFNSYKRELPIGLYSELKDFCEARDYELLVESGEYGSPKQKTSVTPEEIVCYVDSLNIHSRGKKLTIRPYQYEAVYVALRNQRRVLISPTGSGKSLIQYCICRYLLDRDHKILLVVPTTQLVEQMVKDFKDYSSENGWDVESNAHKIYSGYEKSNEKNLVVTTWQSSSKLKPEWFFGFSSVMVDEVQSAKGAELQKLLGKCCNASYRFGLTGSLDNVESNRMLIVGMLGPIHRVAYTRDLMDSGQLADINIKAITLDYNNVIKKAYGKLAYQDEIAFLNSYDPRNKFLTKLILSLEGNTLVLYTRVETHGELLFNMINEKNSGNRPVHFVHGGVDVEDREVMVGIMKEHKNAIAVCSYGTTQAGINIPEINNIVLASPTKSMVRVLQSLGRGTRLTDGKTHFTVYDISDKLSNSKSKPNHTYIHFKERLSIYLKEQFPYKITEVLIG